MENDNTNTINFRTINGKPVAITEQNTKITYTISKRHQIWRFVVEYERVRITRTARARVVYFMYNNRVARFRRAFIPTITHKLHNYGISVSIAE